MLPNVKINNEKTKVAHEYVKKKTDIETIPARINERLKLFDLLCERDSRFSDLEGKKIVTYIEDTKENFTWRELFISPYILKVEE